MGSRVYRLVILEVDVLFDCSGFGVQVQVSVFRVAFSISRVEFPVFRVEFAYFWVQVSNFRAPPCSPLILRCRPASH